MSLFDADDFLVATPDPPMVDAPVDAEPLAEPDDALSSTPDVPPLVEDEVEVTPVVEEKLLDDEIEEALVAYEERVEQGEAQWAPSVDALWDGVTKQVTAVAALRAAGRAPVHAYLLEGSSGVGTRTAARAFAASLLCPRGGCNDCDVCARALVEAHPDLVVVEREGASITVDQAREIIRLAMRSPVEGGRKVLVLVDFHLVTNAAPTMLKIIEEPPGSTIFVILADHLPPELITIASRCVRVPFDALSVSQVISTLMDEGASEDVAHRAARAAVGRLDRARLLVDDPHLGQRITFWEQAPRRLDGTGAAAAVIAAEAVMLLDDAAVAPLEERQRAELAGLEKRLEAVGPRGGSGQRKELTERHKRELKRLRDDELRVGLGLLQGRYRDALVSGAAHSPAACIDAVQALGDAAGYLERNPSLGLMLQALFLRLPSLP